MTARLICPVELVGTFIFSSLYREVDDMKLNSAQLHVGPTSHVMIHIHSRHLVTLMQLLKVDHVKLNT